MRAQEGHSGTSVTRSTSTLSNTHAAEPHHYSLKVLHIATTTMGNSGSTIGDLFFPDNPSRRRRAEELKQQITLYGAEFHSLRVSRCVSIWPLSP